MTKSIWLLVRCRLVETQLTSDRASPSHIQERYCQNPPWWQCNPKEASHELRMIALRKHTSPLYRKSRLMHSLIVIRLSVESNLALTSLSKTGFQIKRTRLAVASKTDSPLLLLGFPESISTEGEEDYLKSHQFTSLRPGMSRLSHWNSRSSWGKRAFWRPSLASSRNVRTFQKLIIVRL